MSSSSHPIPHNLSALPESNEVTLGKNSVEPSDRELVSRAQTGDTDAFEVLVHRYDGKVLSIAHSFTNDPDDAKDIYQEVFLRVYRALPGFRFGSEFSTWLHRIVMNVCLSHKKRKSVTSHAPFDAIPELEIDEGQSGLFSGSRALSPERLAQDDEIRRYVNDAVETLSPKEKLVFTLKHFEGLKIREIAEIMGCGEGTAKRYLFTAVEKLRTRLKRIYR